MVFINPGNMLIIYALDSRRNVLSCLDINALEITYDETCRIKISR